MFSNWLQVDKMINQTYDHLVKIKYSKVNSKIVVIGTYDLVALSGCYLLLHLWRFLHRFFLIFRKLKDSDFQNSAKCAYGPIFQSFIKNQFRPKCHLRPSCIKPMIYVYFEGEYLIDSSDISPCCFAILSCFLCLHFFLG